MPRKSSETRGRIVDAAYTLFRRQGYTRASMDEIASSAEITKRTLYSHFESKDALLASVLEDQHAMALAAFQTFGQALSGSPAAIIRTFFAELLRWSARPRWPGSGFTRIAMELADLPGHPARKIASRHKRQLEAYLAEALARAGAADAEDLARKIWILSEGAMALMLIHGDRAYCLSAEEAALALVERRPELAAQRCQTTDTGSWQESTHSEAASSASRSGTIRSALLGEPSADATSAKARSEASQ